MTQYPGKRRTDAIDLTNDGVPARAAKASRTESSLDSQTISPGQRFGESTGFLPLNQLSQIEGADDEDAQASELVQGSQDSGEGSTGNYVLYGMQSSLGPGSYCQESRRLMKAVRHFEHQNRRSPLLQWHCHSRGACCPQTGS